MAFRFVCWNIKNFSDSLVKCPSNRINRVLDVVNPATGPACDVFVVVEPVSKAVGVGQIGQGAGALGSHRLLTKLQGRTGGDVWRIVPPLCIYSKGKKGEAMVMFYNSAVVRLRGPRTRAAPGDPWSGLVAHQGKIRWLDRATNPPTLRTSDLDGVQLSSVALGTQPEDAYLAPTSDVVFYVERSTNKIKGHDLTSNTTSTKVSAADAGRPTSLVFDAVGQKLYWINDGATKDIRVADLTANSSAVQVNPVGAGQPQGLMLSHGILGWLDRASGELRGCTLSSNTPAFVVARAHAGAQPEGMIVGGTNLYWVDRATNEIRTLDMSARTASTLVPQAHAGQPRDLCLAGGKLFWVHAGAPMEIRQVDLVSKATTSVVAAPAAGQPEGLMVDETQEKICWLDRAGPRVLCANLDGSGVEELVAAARLGTPGPMSIFVGDAWDGKASFVYHGTTTPLTWMIQQTVGRGNFRRRSQLKESCPMLVKFLELSSDREFYVLGFHAPAPTYGGDGNGKAQRGVKEVFQIEEVVSRATPLIFAGDLNLCGMPTPDTSKICTESDGDGHSKDRRVLDNFHATLGYRLAVHGDRSSLKDGDAEWNNYRNHAYDNVIAHGFRAVTNEGVIDLVQPLVADWLAANPPDTSIEGTTFRRKNNPIFKLIRHAKGIGISDHLPVKATFAF